MGQPITFSTGAYCHRPMSANPQPRKKVTPSYEAHYDEGRFLAEVRDANGDVESARLIRFARAVVVVTTEYGDKVAFGKSNRGRTFYDSRTPKKRISADECEAELTRLLQDSWLASRAWNELQV